MSSDLDPLLKRLHLANARRVWRDLLQRAEKEEWTYEALLQTLFAEEVAHRRGTRLARAVRAAAFPFLRTIDEFDFSYQSTLRLTTVGSLLTPDFVTEGHSLILEGKPGRGKTHLAIAVAYRAMQNGFDALFTTAAQLIDHLSAAGRGGGLRDALAVYMKPHVLVVDEVGYLAYGDDAANVLYHVVNDRHIRRRAMIFTTNKHPRRWGSVLHDDDLADAIVDRILERGRLLRLDGPSIRTKHLPEDELRLDELDEPGDRRVSGNQAAEFPERTPTTVPTVTRRPRMHGRPPITAGSWVILPRRSIDLKDTTGVRRVQRGLDDRLSTVERNVGDISASEPARDADLTREIVAVRTAASERIRRNARGGQGAVSSSEGGASSLPRGHIFTEEPRGEVSHQADHEEALDVVIDCVCEGSVHVLKDLGQVGGRNAGLVQPGQMRRLDVAKPA